MSELTSQVSVDNVSKVHYSMHGEPLLALLDVTFCVEHNEFFSIVGPSGCGKTTLLNLLAGFEQPTRGECRVGGELIREPGWQRAVVFQEYALFPWYTVRQNICYGLRRKRLPDAEQRRLADHYIGLVGLRGFESRYPRELSGGMRQRAAIVRALIHDPPLLLMDEPFGALDALTREQMRIDLEELWMQTGKTVLFITHSIDEAVLLADRVIVMSPRPGRIEQVYEIALPRPRGLAARSHPLFIAAAQKITDLFLSKGILRGDSKNA
jgi:NitT/TauT family transport system ATP-binding protein